MKFYGTTYKPIIKTLLGDNLIDVELNDSDFDTIFDVSTQQFQYQCLINGLQLSDSVDHQMFFKTWIENYSLAVAKELLGHAYKFTTETGTNGQELLTDSREMKRTLSNDFLTYTKTLKEKNDV